MTVSSKSHRDRAAATLANLLAAEARVAEAKVAEPECQGPGAGAADCRIDQKLLLWQAQAALAAARGASHLADLPVARHPDLWAGTVQDGVARGFSVRLEECIALADLPRPAAPSLGEPANFAVGRELRKKKDLLVASGGARVRFTRKEGLLFVDRAANLHAANCLRFEARTDRGTLDGFVADPAERARLFSAQFLQPRRYVESDRGQQLELVGRLGRGPIGWPCELVLTGLVDEPFVRVTVRIEQRLVGWRLRARFLGLPSEAIEHECTPVREVVSNDAGGFVAFTLVRACASLLVDGVVIPTPAAACRGTIVHHFRLGSAAAAT